MVSDSLNQNRSLCVFLVGEGEGEEGGGGGGGGRKCWKADK